MGIEVQRWVSTYIPLNPPRLILLRKVSCGTCAYNENEFTVRIRTRTRISIHYLSLDTGWTLVGYMIDVPTFGLCFRVSQEGGGLAFSTFSPAP